MTRIITILIMLVFSKVSSETFEELTNSAINEVKNQNFQLSIELFKKALELDEGNFHVYNRIGRIFYGLNEMDSAIYYYTLTLDIVPDDTVALFERGHSYLEKEDYNNAKSDFSLLFKNSNNSNSDASFNIAKSFFGLSNYEKAIEFYKKTLLLQPKDIYSFYELGVCYASLMPPKKDESLDFYNKAIELNGNYFEAYLNRGLLYATQFNDLEKAHKDFDHCIEISPKNKTPYMYKGMLYRDDEEYGKSKDMFNALIELYPDYAEAYFERAAVWYKIGILNMVCSDLEKAEELGYLKAIDLKKQLCK